MSVSCLSLNDFFPDLNCSLVRQCIGIFHFNETHRGPVIEVDLWWGLIPPHFTGENFWSSILAKQLSVESMDITVKKSFFVP